MSQALTIEQIDALPASELVGAFEQALRHLDMVQAKKAITKEEKAILVKEIQAARLQWALLRERLYPKHFSVQVARIVPGKALAA